MSFFTPKTDPKLFRCGCARPECDALPPSADLLARLETLRYRFERPIQVTSGPRCAWYNRQPAVGGAADSDHLTGQGADLATADSRTRYALLQANFHGPPVFRRLGIGATFLHVGVVPEKIYDVAWCYYPKPTKEGLP